MAHFAQIDADNIVVRILVVPNEQEHRGQEFLANDLGLGGNWIQTSYNNRIRKQYAGIGYAYNPTADVFVAPQPAPWFNLNETLDWVCPDGVNPLTGIAYTSEELEVQQLIDDLGTPTMPGSN